jgi:NADH-quinone oxidoreductase subunit F
VFDPDADPMMAPRAPNRLLPVEQRKNNFQEVELTFSESVALREARRCLRCDYREACAK